MPSVSIVMTYFNRRSQLLKTLATIRYFGHNPKIIVVDDASTERIDDIKGIEVIRIEPKDKWWVNPCVAYNIGFSHATSEIVIIQNPECAYTGDIVGYVLRNLERNDWMSFAAYSIDYTLNFTYDNVPLLRGRILKEPQHHQHNHVGWYNHSKHRPIGFHFCAAIFRKDLERLGGFDERYANGIAFDDDDLILRIKRAGMNVRIVDDPFVIHQKHERTPYGRMRDKYNINKVVYHQQSLKETFVKAPSNGAYMKEWYLTPKILHVFWGMGRLPYLRYMTVVSFMRLNPDWEVWLWYSEYPSKVVTWKTREMQYSVECDDYLPRLMELPIRKVPLDFDKYGFRNDASEVHKSDYIRYYAMREAGGVYSDMDILYFRPITDLAVNMPNNFNVGVFVCISSYGHSNGFFMSKKGAAFFDRLCQLSSDGYDPDEYQCLGPDLCNKNFPTLKSIFPLSSAMDFGMDAVYAHDGQHIRDIYNSNHPRFTKNSIGIHWYGGHPLAGAFLNATNGGLTNLPNNIIGNLIHEQQIHSTDNDGER